MPRRKRRTETPAAVEAKPKSTTGVLLNYTQACCWLQQVRQDRTGGLIDAIKAKLKELGVKNLKPTLDVPNTADAVTCNPRGVLRWVEALKADASKEEKAQLVGLYAAVVTPGRTRRRRRRRG
jgi:hypothetical protein